MSVIIMHQRKPSSLFLGGGRLERTNYVQMYFANSLRRAVPWGQTGLLLRAQTQWRVGRGGGCPALKVTVVSS